MPDNLERLSQPYANSQPPRDAGKYKGCPFCGVQPLQFREWDGNHRKQYSVECIVFDCPARPRVVAGSRKARLKAWNTRA